MKNILKFHKLTVLMMLVAFVGLLTACGAAGMAPQAAYDMEMSAPAEEPMPPMYAEDSMAEAGYAEADRNAVNISIDDSLSSAVSQAQLETRVIIYTGDIALVVKDTQEAIAGITQLAVEKGGYISSSNLYQSGDVPRGSITLRVPAELYQDTPGCFASDGDSGGAREFQLAGCDRRVC